MTEQATPGWLDMLADMLGCSPSFREAMDEQLAEQAFQRAGIDVRRGFALLPPDATFVPRYDDAGIGYVEADLVGPDGWGEYVVLAWEDTAPEAHRVLPQADVPSSVSGRLRFWWHEFPDDDLRSHYGGIGEQRAELPGMLPFPVQREAYAWPDVWLEVHTDRPPGADALHRLTVFLEEKRSAWNAGAEQGLIHNFDAPQVLGAARFQLHVDFGSAPPAALAYWLKALAEAPLGTSITAVHLRGFPES